MRWARAAALLAAIFVKIAAAAETGVIFVGDTFVKELVQPSEFDELLQRIKTAGASGGGDGRDASSDAELAVVFMYAGWCPHCHKAAPTYRELAKAASCTRGIRFFSFECSDAANRTQADRTPVTVCRDEQVMAYPTIKVLWNRNAFGEPGHAVLPTDSKNGTTNSGNKTAITIDEEMGVRLKSLDNMRNWIFQHTPITTFTPCSADMLAARDPPRPLQSGMPIVEKKIRWPENVWLFGKNPGLRLHDAYLGLLFLLQNWVYKEGTLSPERNDQLRQLLATMIAVLPGLNVKVRLVQLHAFLGQYARRHEELAVEEYQKVTDVTILAGLGPLKTGMEPIWQHSQTITSSTWLLFHTMTVALAQLHSVNEVGNVAPTAGGFLPHRKPRVLEQTEIRDLGELAGLSSEDAAELQKEVHLLRQNFRTDPFALSQTIRLTVQQFFGCDFCRRHFVRQFDNCGADLCRWVLNKTESYTVKERETDSQGFIDNAYKGLVMWLWRFHNIVTTRTAVERTAWSEVTAELMRQGVNTGEAGRLVSYEGQDVRFPPLQACPECRNMVSQIKNEILTVSRPLIDRGIAQVRADLGRTNTSDGGLAGGGRMTDVDFDMISDFDLEKTFQYITKYYWMVPWSDDERSLQWDNAKFVFDTPRLPISTLKTENVELDGKRRGTGDHRAKHAAANPASAAKALFDVDADDGEKWGWSLAWTMCPVVFIFVVLVDFTTGWFRRWLLAGWRLLPYDDKRRGRSIVPTSCGYSTPPTLDIESGSASNSRAHTPEVAAALRNCVGSGIRKKSSGSSTSGIANLPTFDSPNSLCSNALESPASCTTIASSNVLRDAQINT